MREVLGSKNKEPYVVVFSNISLRLVGYVSTSSYLIGYVRLLLTKPPEKAPACGILMDTDR
jgi:hypothetical protein